MARACSVCTSPWHADIDRALVASESYRTITDRFGVTRQALLRHKEAHLPEVLALAQPEHGPKRTTQPDRQPDTSPRHADQHADHSFPVSDHVPAHARALVVQQRQQAEAELAHAYSLDDLCRLYSALAVKTALACDRDLTDPRDPTQYTLAPRAHEIEVVYWQTVGEGKNARQVRQVAQLDALLTRLDVDAGVQVDRTRVKVADTRELVLKAAGELRAQAQTMAGFLEKAHGAEQMRIFKETVLEVLGEVAPDVRIRVLAEVRRRLTAG